MFHAVWVENGGIVGRGVLLDYCTWAEETQGISPVVFETTIITLSDLQKVAEFQNVTFHPGDILLIRSGYVKATLALTPEELAAVAAQLSPPVIGVNSSKDMLKWIWETGFSAVAGDMPSFEAWPCQDAKFFLHEWLLAGWGLPIGELFDLERLAAECKEKKKWSFMFSSMPLKVCLESCDV
jgi:Putative cyclase